MRISDWSSDVCSSDLLDRAVEAGERAVQHLHAVADLEVDLQLRLGRSGRLLVARVQDSRRLGLADRLRLARRTEKSRHLRPFLHQEIGRAPVGDTVCYYVSISEYAVRLKTSKKPKINYTLYNYKSKT